MNFLPNDLIRYIGNEYLNPQERSCLGSTCKSLNNALPVPLRIKIVSSGEETSTDSLKTEFLVSDVQTPNKYLLPNENLIYGQPYLIWTFDYERSNKVYLGRHTRHGGRVTDQTTETTTGQSSPSGNSVFTLGLRPCQPTQFWKIQTLSGNSADRDGDCVMWGEDICLAVSGNNPKPRQPDSIHPSVLSCQRQRYGHRDGDSDKQKPGKWCVIDNNNNNYNGGRINEKMQLYRCDTSIPPNISFPYRGHFAKRLSVYAIPEVSDEGEYLLLNPDSLRDGIVGCEGEHVVVDFHFWISDNGIMHLKASALDFSLGIPILETDFETSVDVGNDDGVASSFLKSNNNKSPLSNLLKIRSARWGCVIYYMAVAADANEGVKPDMNRFVNCVTDHSDHGVDYNRVKQMVTVNVRNKNIDKTISSTSKDPNRLWKFVLSW